MHRLGIALLLAVGVACGDPPRVGVVDLQRAFQISPLAMVSAHEIKTAMGGADREIKKHGRALAELRQQLEHGGLELDPDQRAALDARLAEETAALVEMQRSYREKLAAAQARQGEAMIARVEEMAREVAQREGLALLVRSDGVVYNAADFDVATIDLTEQVARALLERINPTVIPEPSSATAPSSVSEPPSE